ncbi:hypothetical protein BGZ51_006300 [Haplosporangium sp. Z 767]|nr:hypothetical protein BGZ51_006300 [Haplosporangium sp. Z 767]
MAADGEILSIRDIHQPHGETGHCRLWPKGARPTHLPPRPQSRQEKRLCARYPLPNMMMAQDYDKQNSYDFMEAVSTLPPEPLSHHTSHIAKDFSIPY